MKIHMVCDRLMFEIEKAVVAWGVLIISVSVIVNVICRYFRIPVTGFEEVCKFTVVWLTFLGGSLCTRRGLHISMTAIRNKIPEKMRKYVIISISAVSGIFCIILGIFGWQLTYALFSVGQVSSALRVPIWYVYISFPIGYFLSGINFIRIVIKNLKEEGIFIGIEREKQEDLLS